MTNYRLVMPGDLNNYGALFGGQLLRWVDEDAWIAASLDFPGCRFVTIGMDRVEFRRSSRQGDILRFEALRVKTGTTSATYAVEVFQHHGDAPDSPMFLTQVTLVRVDETGKKIPLPNPGDGIRVF